MAKEKTAVVTGGAGFIGSHLCRRLLREGYRVISLDNYFTGSPENHVAGVEYREGHTKHLGAHVPERPDILFHLGEYARVEKSFEDAPLVWDLNIAGTFGVLEFWREKGCKLVYAGSSTKFADGGAGKDQSPYAWSKAANTEQVRNYGTWYGLPYAIAYFNNAYGPGERAGAYGTVVRIFTEQYRRGEPLTVVAPGTQTRHFTHVEDIVDGLLLVAERGEGDGYVIGADEAYSVQALADMFGGPTVLLPARPGNRMDSPIDTRAMKALGWRPRWRLPDYVARVREEVREAPSRAARIVVCAPTFYPGPMGRAERALLETMASLPHIAFDVVTARGVGEARAAAPEPLPKNVRVQYVGRGSRWDKYALPWEGARRIARILSAEQDRPPLLLWSLFASYGALAAFFARRHAGVAVPLLITLADQDISGVPWHKRAALRFLLRDADQVAAAGARQAHAAQRLARRTALLRALREGDAFAHQIRFVFSQHFAAAQVLP